MFIIENIRLIDQIHAGDVPDEAQVLPDVAVSVGHVAVAPRARGEAHHADLDEGVSRGIEVVKGAAAVAL